MAPEAPLWIFGYGSLLWRAEFPAIATRTAWIEGWSRRFWQGSTDHRGVPGAPGRVVTLVPEPGAQCWGRAFLLDRAASSGILAELDFREKNGYERLELPLHIAGTQPVAGLTYIATAANAHYLGPAPLPEIAAQIHAAEGPSGANREYLENLHRVLAEIGCPDPHVDAIREALSVI